MSNDDEIDLTEAAKHIDVRGGDRSIVSGRDTNITINLYRNDQPQISSLAQPALPEDRIRFGLPPKPDRLEGRSEELAELADRLIGQGGGETSVVPNTIHGMGGVGKTALSLWFAYEHLADFSLILWIDAEDTNSIPAQYVQFAQAIGYGSELKPEEAMAVVMDQLASRSTWLLVFDNAESRQDIASYLPSLAGGSGSVVITSRNPVGWANSIPLEVLEQSDVVAWLLDAVGSDDEVSAASLAEALDGLPLAVTQAAGYCDANSTPLATYVKLFQEEQAKLLAGRPYLDAKATVDTTFNLSLAKLDADPAARPSVLLLEYCSFLAPDRIPLYLFTEESLGVELSSEIEEAVGRLRRYSLIGRDGGLLYVHRLVQAVTRMRLDSAPAKA